MNTHYVTEAQRSQGYPKRSSTNIKRCKRAKSSFLQTMFDVQFPRFGIFLPFTITPTKNGPSFWTTLKMSRTKEMPKSEHETIMQFAREKDRQVKSGSMVTSESKWIRARLWCSWSNWTRYASKNTFWKQILHNGTIILANNSEGESIYGGRKTMKLETFPTCQHH